VQQGAMCVAKYDGELPRILRDATYNAVCLSKELATESIALGFVPLSS
jgi:hypothetical protein